MGVFSNAQGQLTPQSVVESCRISNSSEILWLSSIPAIMKNIRSKMKTLVSANKIIWHFFRRSRATYSEVSGGILPKFELIEAFIVFHVTCKNEEDPIKIKEQECLQDFPHFKSMGIFFRCSRAANSAVLGRIWLKFKVVRDIIDVLLYLQV